MRAALFPIWLAIHSQVAFNVTICRWNAKLGHFEPNQHLSSARSLVFNSFSKLKLQFENCAASVIYTDKGKNKTKQEIMASTHTYYKKNQSHTNSVRFMLSSSQWLGVNLEWNWWTIHGRLPGLGTALASVSSFVSNAFTRLAFSFDFGYCNF